MIVLIIIALFAFQSSSMAQNRVKKTATRKTTVNSNKNTSGSRQKSTDDASFTFSCKLFEIILGGDHIPANNGICQLKVYDFGNNWKTVMFELPKELSDEFKANGLESSVFSWSGNIKLIPAKQIIKRSSIFDGYLVTYGNIESLAGLLKSEKGWSMVVGDSKKSPVVYDIYPGMSISQVENKMKELKLSQFKETGRSGGYTIYTLYWLNMQETYYSNNKVYGRFYFDRNSKLHKWIFYN